MIGMAELGLGWMTLTMRMFRSPRPTACSAHSSEGEIHSPTSSVMMTAGVVVNVTMIEAMPEEPVGPWIPLLVSLATCRP